MNHEPSLSAALDKEIENCLNEAEIPSVTRTKSLVKGRPWLMAELICLPYMMCSPEDAKCLKLQDPCMKIGRRVGELLRPQNLHCCLITALFRLVSIKRDIFSRRHVWIGTVLGNKYARFEYNQKKVHYIN